MLIEVPGVQLDFVHALCRGGIRHAPKESSGDAAPLELGMHADLINLMPIARVTEDVLRASLLANKNVSNRFTSDITDPNCCRPLSQDSTKPQLESSDIGVLEYVRALMCMERLHIRAQMGQ